MKYNIKQIPSPFVLLIIITVVIALGELFIPYLTAHLPSNFYILKNIIRPIFLISSIFSLIYLLIYRPFNIYHKRLIQDIAKKKEREREIEELKVKGMHAAKMASLGEMAGGLAHEVNTPLGVIVLCLDQLGTIITESQHKVELGQTIIDDTKDACQRINKIVKGLRKFSKESLHEIVKRQSFDKIIEDALLLTKMKLNNHGITIETNSGAKEVELCCYPTLLSELLIDLINNSRHAIENLDQKWIKIDITDHKDEVEISITDSGQGIAFELHEKIFTPFFTTKEIGTATGLGLSNCYGITKKHGGEIYLDNQCSNTCFKIRLPKNFLKTDNQESQDVAS